MHYFIDGDNLARHRGLLPNQAQPVEVQEDRRVLLCMLTERFGAEAGNLTVFFDAGRQPSTQDGLNPGAIRVCFLQREKVGEVIGALTPQPGQVTVVSDHEVVRAAGTTHGCAVVGCEEFWPTPRPAKAPAPVGIDEVLLSGTFQGKALVGRVIRAEDHVSAHLELPEILPAAELADLLSDQLERRWFKKEGAVFVRREDDVVITVDPRTGIVTVKAAGGEATIGGELHGRAYDDVGPHAGLVRENLRREALDDLAQHIAEKASALQGRVIDELENKLGELQGELSMIASQVIAEALGRTPPVMAEPVPMMAEAVALEPLPVEPATVSPVFAEPMPLAPPPAPAPVAPAPAPVCAAAPAPPPAPLAVALDTVHFSVTCCATMTPGSSQVLDVWAHLEEQRKEVIARAREAVGGKDLLIRSKAGLPVARGTLLTVSLRLPGFTIEEPEDVLRWEGSIGNTSFLVQVPKELRPGSYPGTVRIHANSLQVARLHFTVEVGPGAVVPEAIPITEHRPRKAFASYASHDRDAVLARVQGLQKALPGLDVFLDVASLRSGQKWEERLRAEVTGRDIFYLFWSAHAKQSEWVEWEWRTALGARGIDYIDPVPLAAPEEAPPPRELAEHLHFNDWVLAYMRTRKTPPEIVPERAPQPEWSQPRLLVLRGQKRNVEYPIYEGSNFLGRADEKPVDIDLEDQEPPDRIWSSRQHAVIFFEDGGIFIEDLNSANGTYVNRARVHPGQRKALAVNDIIQIGNVQMKLLG